MKSDLNIIFLYICNEKKEQVNNHSTIIQGEC
jgi:hypothetical protein